MLANDHAVGLEALDLGVRVTELAQQRLGVLAQQTRRARFAGSERELDPVEKKVSLWPDLGD